MCVVHALSFVHCHLQVSEPVCFVMCMWFINNMRGQAIMKCDVALEMPILKEGAVLLSCLLTKLLSFQVCIFAWLWLRFCGKGLERGARPNVHQGR